MAPDAVGFVQGGQDPVQLRGGQDRGGAAAEIEGAHRKARLPQELRPPADVQDQVVGVLAEHPLLLRHLRSEGTVEAPAPAEGDVQVHGGAFRRHGFDMGPLDGSDLLHQRLLFRGHREQLPEGAPGLRLPLPLRDLPKELGGPDARQGAPGGGHGIEFLHDLVDAQLQRPLLLPLHVQGVEARLDRHDPLHVLGHSEAPRLTVLKDHEQPQLRFWGIGQDVRLPQKQTDLLGHVVEKALGVGDQLNHG